THLDSHHNVHRDPRVLPQFVALATELGLPLRDHWPVHHCSRFYGQWNGESHPEQISAENLLHILEMEMSEGVTELSCHPGYVDAGFTTSYSAEREAELRTLCDAALRRALAARGIHLANYHHLEQLLPRAAAA
ncbi:MAG: ChbG/HpnK family deacetylase, partial [Verrucomicrobia bacterium]